MASFHYQLDPFVSSLPTAIFAKTLSWGIQIFQGRYSSGLLMAPSSVLDESELPHYPLGVTD